LSYTDRPEPQSVSGSNTQLSSAPLPQYTPDFNVRALADLQFVKAINCGLELGIVMFLSSRFDGPIHSTHGRPQDARDIEGLGGNLCKGATCLSCVSLLPLNGLEVSGRFRLGSSEVGKPECETCEGKILDKTNIENG
ncbi:hypothetical protein cypCar_00019882, partial [Cyprinus carpio]